MEKRIHSFWNKKEHTFAAIKRAAGALGIALGIAALLPVSAWAKTYDISDGKDLYVNATSEGTKVARSSSDEGTLDTEEIIITGKKIVTVGSCTKIVISADSGCTAKVTLKDLTDTMGYNFSAYSAPISTSGEGDVEIELDGVNTLAGGSGFAGLEKNDDKHSGTLTICDNNGTAGTLNATGGRDGAGIGGGGWPGYSSGNIIITSGTVNANGGIYGAGIGGSAHCSGHDIKITGGTVTAQGGYSQNYGGAGIGGGEDGDGYNIDISGGTVKAIGGRMGAGIGGCDDGAGHDITISGGKVTAWGCTKDGNGAGIGGGENGDGYNIYISGGTVEAKSSYFGGAGIGSGGSGRAYDIYISGGDITAISAGYSGVAIGSGASSWSSKKGWGKIVISGGNVTARDNGSYPTAIIGGRYGATVSEYVEIKDTANVTIEYLESYQPEKYITWITTCELLEGGKLEWKEPNYGGEVYKTITGAAGNQHSWGKQIDEKYILSDAVCNQPSTYYMSCTKCGMKSPETFISDDAPGHLYKSLTDTTEPWWYDADVHCHECIRENCPDREGSHKDVAEHSFTEGGEDWDGDGKYDYEYKHCTVCYYDALHTHSEYSVELIPEEPATCTKDGNKEYYKCKYCKKPFKVAELGGVYVEISKDEVIDPATGHQADTYSSDSVKHWQVCTVCGNDFNINPHHYNAGETKEETSGGKTYEVTEYTCECGRSYKDKKQTGKDSTDDTDKEIKTSSSGSGDSNAPGTWIKDSKGWKFMPTNGGYAKGQAVLDANGNSVDKILWLTINSKEYAFGSDGYLITGWVYDALQGRWYYCDENEGKRSGWLLNPLDGYWYYLSSSTGEMLSGWQSINDKYYYFETAPSAPTYSFDAATDRWIYSSLKGVRPLGSMYAGTVTPDNYAVDASGAWIH